MKEQIGMLGKEYKMFECMLDQAIKNLGYLQVCQLVDERFNSVANKFSNEHLRDLLLWLEEQRKKKTRPQGNIIFGSKNILDIAATYCSEIKNNKTICINPKHEDTEPSLQFYPETNSFYCFGCLQGGSVVQFVMLAENCDYHHACKILAEKYRVIVKGKEKSLVQKMEMNK